MPDLRRLLHAGEDSQEEGSAAVEFVFLSLLLMVPVLYFVITVAQIQAAGFAAAGASDQAAKVAATSGDDVSAGRAVDQAVTMALSDQGLPRSAAAVRVDCQPSDCRAPGTAVTVQVEVTVPLPFTPPGVGLNAAHVSSSGTQIVGRFR
ncbi:MULTISPECIES: hypothetical protein [Arthrobacter]|uniref:Flp pilus assembly protein TadG n=2 Tax=Arthrobacter TaxID=1663 RepID=A0ABU9KKH8_9MICC|nr:hypothetical protein [Arthrobacter sp. YJM1]MDP5227262.1 hypothetical protein [Arthrobacter sp. YJM1]